MCGVKLIEKKVAMNFFGLEKTLDGLAKAIGMLCMGIFEEGW